MKLFSGHSKIFSPFFSTNFLDAKFSHQYLFFASLTQCFLIAVFLATIHIGRLYEKAKYFVFRFFCYDSFSKIR